MKFASDLALVGACLVLMGAVLASCSEEQDAGTSPPGGYSPEASDGMRVAALRRAVIANGFVPASELAIPVEPSRAEAGRLIFESDLMSLNGKISCRDCHLDEFGSTDGLPNAVGVGGEGKGAARLRASDGQVIPRNVLPFWGRGGAGFDTFFWDGKVAVRDGKVVSQFGDRPPSDDPLVVAVHLPSVELREMVADTPQVRAVLVSEQLAAAEQVQSELARRFANDDAIGQALARAYGKRGHDLTFGEVADALASFIRHEFRVWPTGLEQFVFEDGPITSRELAGGILFYGRGKCASCHGGPYFSDLQFHAVAFPQTGFGKNGFGIDEGRYNVTLDPADRFLFRTPPLYNVTKTAPYSHSGSLPTLEQAIVAHFDPLRFVDTTAMTPRERADLYSRLGSASGEILPASLTDEEVSAIVAFLALLDFEAPDP